MNKVKLTLIFVVIVTLILSINFIVSPPPPGPPPPIREVNLFILEVNDSIRALQNIFDRVSIEEYIIRHEKTSLMISGYAIGKHFDSIDPIRNNQIKDDFERSLFALFSQKFIKSTFVRFNTENWDYQDFGLIQQVKNSLITSRYLTANSSTGDSLNLIQDVLNKYHEINAFIQSCLSVRFIYDDNSFVVPRNDIALKIIEVQDLLRNNLGNEYVNNSSLREALEGVPQTFFDKHVEYLNDRITYIYQNYRTLSTWQEFIDIYYTPLGNDINALTTLFRQLYPEASEYTNFTTKRAQLYRIVYGYFNN